MAEGVKDFQARHKGDDRRLAPAQADKAFALVSDFEPKGDQPAAIAELVTLERGDKHQVLLFS